MTVHCLVFNGFSDWEIGFILPELRKNSVDVITVGFSKEPVLSMGGLKILSDMELNSVKDDNLDCLLIPGGQMWEQSIPDGFIERLKDLDQRNVVIGGICGATLALAKAGLLDNNLHTSNDLGYMKAMVPEYKGEAFYSQDLSVSDKNIITASGLGAIEFARDVLVKLKIYDVNKANQWFDLFKYAKWTGPL